MEQLRQMHKRYYEVADRQLSTVGAVRAFEEKTGVPKVYGVAGVAALVGSMVFFNVAAPLLVNLTGFGYAETEPVLFRCYYFSVSENEWELVEMNVD
ncbi:hypothetical protein IW150_005457 [Coemansia sp. RSA 2607]|nr:hypothetical protein IW150_005457 [Coemansia sp. RSA 2607]